MKRVFIIAGAAVAILVAAAFGVHAYMDWARRQDKFPVVFTEIPAGTRAPQGQTRAFGVDIGKTTLPELTAWQSEHGVTCNNTSMRALMQQKRENTQAKMKEAEEKGEDPDGVTGASLANYHSRKEQNPQVRLACENVDGAQLKDRPREGEHGRVLIVLDSEKLPVRHVVFSQKVQDAQLALVKFNAAVAEMEKRFGPSTGSTGGDIDPANPFPLLKVFRREWRFTNLRAEVSGTSFGTRGVDVKEMLEVPWPVRSDAPVLPSAPAPP